MSSSKGPVKPHARDAGFAVACTSDDAGLEPGVAAAGDAASAGDAAARKPGLCTATGECEEAIAVTSAQHVSGTINYRDPPPVGGNHNVCWTTWGVHAQPVGAEHWVHNLEHGGVIFLYHCTKPCACEVSRMADFVQAHRLALLVEYDAMPKRFAVVAWGYRL